MSHLWGHIFLLRWDGQCSVVRTLEEGGVTKGLRCMAPNINCNNNFTWKPVQQLLFNMKKNHKGYDREQI